MEIIKNKRIIPKGGVKPLILCSPDIFVGDMVYTSDHISINPVTGSLVQGGLEAEVHQAPLNLSVLLEAAGSSLSQVI